MSVAHRTTATELLEFKNDFAAAFALRSVFNRSFDFAKWIRFFDFCFEQTAPGHLEKRLECLHSLPRSGVVVPFVDPDAAKPQVLENEQAGRNFQRLQAHCAKTHQRATRCETICKAQRAITADR